MANKSYTPEKVAEVVALAKSNGAKVAAEKHKVSYQTVLRWVNGPSKGAKPVRKRPGQAAPVAASGAHQNGASVEGAMQAYQTAKAALDAAKTALVAAL